MLARQFKSPVELKTQSCLIRADWARANLSWQFLCPSLENRGPYCFAPVCLLFGWPVDLVLSAQYLLTPLLESCQTWYSGCIYRVDVFILHVFSGHMVKSKGHTTDLCTCTNDIRSISFNPFESCQTWYSDNP